MKELTLYERYGHIVTYTLIGFLTGFMFSFMVIASAIKNGFI